MFLTFAGQSFKSFNCLRAIWPKGYQLGSLGKRHKNGDYLKQAMRKSYPPTIFDRQPLYYRFTALPLELERMFSRLHNFGYLNPATCFIDK